MVETPTMAEIIVDMLGAAAAKAIAERNEALRKLAQAEGHNKILRGQVEQLKAALNGEKAWSRGLKQANQDLHATIERLHDRLRAAEKGAGPTRPAWRRTVAENLRAQAIDDSAEPQFTAQEVSDAKAIVEAQAEYQRMARGEPVTDECPTCSGTGTMLGIPDAGRCGTCGGTKVVQDAAPAHLDTEREGAADDAMSRYQDPD